MIFNWEKIDEKSEDGIFWHATYRAPVIGGWIIRSFDLTEKLSNLSTSESMVFVPDPTHTWDIYE